MTASYTLAYIWSSGNLDTGTGEGKTGHAAMHFHIDEQSYYISFSPNVAWYQANENNFPNLSRHKPYGRFIQNLSIEINDNDNEHRPPDFIFAFRNLDATKMLKRFIQIKEAARDYNKLEVHESVPSYLTRYPRKIGDINEEGLRWTLCGGSTALDDAESSWHSCVSMVWALLEAGGVSQYMSAVDSVTAVSTGLVIGSRDASRAVSASDADRAGRASSYVSTLGATLLFNIKSPDSLAEILKKAKSNELKKHGLPTLNYICPTTKVEEWRPSIKVEKSYSLNGRWFTKFVMMALVFFFLAVVYLKANSSE